jgi:hypothetical protein
VPNQVTHYSILGVHSFFVCVDNNRGLVFGVHSFFVCVDNNRGLVFWSIPFLFVLITIEV